jgi:hypothetical protein
MTPMQRRACLSIRGLRTGKFGPRQSFVIAAWLRQRCLRAPEIAAVEAVSDFRTQILVTKSGQALRYSQIGLIRRARRPANHGQSGHRVP